MALQRRYGFDGILVNLSGRDPEWRDSVGSIEKHADQTLIRRKEGPVTIVPLDDNPRVVGADRRRRRLPSLDEIDPERLLYIEPHDRLRLTRSRSDQSELAALLRFLAEWHEQGTKAAGSAPSGSP